MVRITKTIQPKHTETFSSFISNFGKTACSISLPLLPQHLAQFPTRWPFPRGDLYHWISLLNRFDVILDRFCTTYKLADGPQKVGFGCEMLESNVGATTDDTKSHDLVELGYGEDGDRQLIEAILKFSKMLLENCGNRSIYSSSPHLGSLLNTTSMSLLENTLLVTSQLAQRYNSAMKRVGSARSSKHLLAEHYNIDLNKVLQLALPFSKTITTPPDSAHPTTPNPTTPGAKGKEKEKAYFNLPASHKNSTTVVYANDLVSIYKGGSGVSTNTKIPRSGSDNTSSAVSQASWDDWGDIRMTYYPKTKTEPEPVNNALKPADTVTIPVPPVTPTQVRRSSNLGPNAQRANRSSATEETPPTLTRTPTMPSDDAQRQNAKTIEISSAKLRSTDIYSLMQEYGLDIPQDLQYELFTKIRIAKALISSLETRQQVLVIRMLAVANMANVYAEPLFLENIMKQDGDEPKRLQFIYQVADLVHPPAEGDIAVSTYMQTLAFSTLEAVAGISTKFQDVCKALNTTINHGVMLYVIRKAVAEMAVEDLGDKLTDKDQWRNALFSLMTSLCQYPRTAEGLVTAGLIPIMIEILGLRTTVAQRYQPKTLSFLDNVVYSAREAFQILVNANGLDRVSDLIVHETSTAFAIANSGDGIPSEHCSQSTDYEIPFYQQQILKWLFKFIHHMMSSANSYGGNFDRLLRNLIDSSQLLGSLHQIIGNGRVFGSIVWTNAVGILNGFINNEPTSFAIIAEAGLSRGFLEAVSGAPIVMPQPPTSEGVSGESNQAIDGDGDSSSASSDEDEDDEPLFEVDNNPHPPTLEMLQAPRRSLAWGIMPTQETINIVPQAFSALCLNNAGMKMFRASHALESFFEIFESPQHVSCMELNGELPSSLGGTFDELVRHHPPLKGAIINAILDMVVRVGYLCKTKAEKNRAGAKLWNYDSAGNVIAPGAPSTSPADTKGKGTTTDNVSDIEMRDVDDGVPAPVSAKDSDSSMTPYITSVASFLATVLNNSAVRTEFCARGGIEYVLDLAESQSLPANFGDGISSRNLQNVIALLAEQKPHLVIPSLLTRAQAAVEILEPFATHDFSTSFFAPFVDHDLRGSADSAILAQGTAFAKAFVNIHSLVANLTASIQGSPYSHRNAPPVFNSMNFADHYNRLIQTLAPLLGAALKEEILLQKLVPKNWQLLSTARIRDNGISDATLDAVVSTEPSPPPVNVPTPAVVSDPPSRPLHPDYVPTPGPSILFPSASPAADVAGPEPDVNLTLDISAKPYSQLTQNSAEFRNYGTLRYLLGRMPRVIGPFFQNVGKVLLSKRSLELYYRQSHATIAEALSESVLKQLARPGDDNSNENYSYWIGLLSVLKDMLIDSSRHTDRQVQTISLVLQAFKDRSGFTTLNHILEAFTCEIRASNVQSREQQVEEKTPEQVLKIELATFGAKQILSFYGILVNSKHILEVPQTLAMIPRNDRDRDRSHTFSPGQFVVELRMAILPTVRGLWQSDLIENAPSQISEKLIEVIRTIASTEGESGAIKRSETQPDRPTKSPRKVFKINSDNVNSLKDQGYDEDLAKEALYRCNNILATSADYCKEQKKERTRGRCPIPDDDIEVAPEPSGHPGPLSGSTGSASPNEQSMTINPTRPDVTAIVSSLQQIAATLPHSSQSGTPGSGSDFTPQGFDRIMNQFVPGYENRNRDTSNAAGPSASRESPLLTPQQSIKAEEILVKQVTVDDLNDERKLIRDNLIDKCLDVINAHGDVTFEISDLITTVVNKSPDPPGLKKVVGETLVFALMSFAGEEDVRTDGGKIAAYAHLLALMLREKQFYAAAVGELKENLSTLLSFVKLSPSHSAEEPSPWIAQILLIVEMLLSEDAKPRKAKWTAPKSESEKIEAPVIEHVELAVSEEERSQLLESIMDILPRIGKEESLALAVLRILVILTRTRSVAQGMGEKKNIQRLFVMAKQLAGASSTRIHGPLLLILRHIIEDDETIKQIMRSDIKAFFDHNIRPQRSPVDLQLYLRGLQHVANRAPALFVQVTNEMVKFTGWPFLSSDPTSRAPSLVLKGDPTSGNTFSVKVSEDAVQPTVQATEDLTLQDLKPTTEVVDTDMPDVGKAASPEHKTPVVENPDGVIHFLLCELMNYKDVEDKDRPTTSHANKPTSSSDGDVAMVGAPSVPDLPALKGGQSLQVPTKQEFKAEEHPIYIYRCFLLQCLTELLSAYNRTKIEFINFKRSAPPQAMTPSKPRSSVLHYLLADLLPIGTLDYAETTTLRKKLTTSHWADSVITALLNKTGEQILDKLREQTDGEDEPDLLFVRRFVLENVLKAYKDASASTEPLEVRYARMLSLADLMMHIMTGKENLGAADTAVSKRSQMQLKRIMFEKGYIAALTASVADIDLNFPGAKRAVKYILRPLKQLTHHAIYLSENSLITSLPGQADEDDIESATSVSDLEDEREETPDLFRNSTLGMFEQGDENDTSSDSEDDDEDMYEGEYDDGMDYEEEMEQDDEENVSDEDEDDGMGPIEGLSGDHGVDVEVIMEDEDDDDEDDDSEDDEDDDEHGSDGMDDDDARLEILDEVGNVQQLAEDEDLDEWESENDEEMQEDDEEDYEEGYEEPGEDNEAAHVHAHSMGDMGPIGNLVRVLAGAGDEEDAVEMLQRMEEEGVGDPEDDEDEPLGEYMEEIEEEEDEEDEDDMDEEMLFEHAYPGQSNIRPSSAVRLIDQADGPGPIFDYEGEVEPPIVISHRGHQGRQRHALPSPFPLFPGGSRDPLGGRSQLSELEAIRRAAERHTQELESLIQMAGMISGQPRQNRTDRVVVPDFRYRAHRSGAPPPHSTDDGTNPLLQRNGPSGSSRPGHRGPPMGSWIQAAGPGGSLIDMSSFLGGRAFGDSPEQILDMIRSLRIPGSIARNGQALQFHITAGPGQLPRELEAMFGTRRPRSENHRDTSEPGSATSFSTQCTAARWAEESKMLFGASNIETAHELINEILAALVPPAIEADKVIKAAELEKIRVLEEEKQKRLEAEKLAKEVKEAEKAAKEKKEAEEREAAERTAAEIVAARSTEVDEQIDESVEANNASAIDAMEGVQSEVPEAATNVETQETEVLAADRPRVMAVIRGNPFDITDLGIDAEFLAELPEEIREEVIMAAVAERRQQATATGSQPTDIDQEFLDALPDDIRQEIMQQEAQERRRRERIERREAGAAAGGAPPNEDMDIPSILATLSPTFRQEVLMDGDEAFMASLPPDLAAQARQLRRAQPDHPGHPGRAPVGVIRRVAPGEENRNAPQQPRTRRAIVQMLDKQGVATLLRLMFVFQHSSFRNTLNSVLQNVALNKHNRAELISTLLHILQDGSADMIAIERSFSYLSVRAKQPREKDPKTPTQTIRRTVTGLGSLAQTNSEASPLMVVQQCLTALVYLAQTNLHVASFFLTEHEPSGGLKRSLSRKGKGKDSKAPRYALNSLLSLLDRDLIMESATIMEQLSLLLNIVTSPLIALERKQKEAIEEAEKAKAAATPNETAETTGTTDAPNPENATTGESDSTEQTSTLQEANAPTENPSADSASASVPSALVITTDAAEGETSTVPETNIANPEDASRKEEKKVHVFTPPIVPEHNLRLVTNIFCCECNSKTFRETISTIKNLSTIPGAKAIFGKELVAKARALGEVILVDLQDLLPQIQKARTGTEIQGVALAKFSPPASDQHKLLRVLTALDHLFDPKREKKDDAASEAEASSEMVEKQDLLSSLYENSTFGPMWEKLSACLSTIRQQDHMLSVATILLPLIESLMVVCKNTTLKDAPLARATKNKEMSLASPVPESRMENLFFTFTEEHRKILNDLVRHTPKLMSGTFSLLVKNPKVLEFDNKRNYFSRSIHSRSQTSRAVPPLQLSVRREQVFHDSFKSLYFQTPDQMKYGKLSIRFHGEEGVDAGGVTREWFQVLSRQMFDPGYALFIPVSSDRTTFHPNQLSSINEEHLMFFKFIGRIIGKALYEGRVLDCHFSRAVYKRILGKAVSVKDMESLDPDYYKSLIWMLENDITDIITETFSVDNDKFGVVETIDFKENGRNIAVTEENKHEYVRLMVEWRLTGSVKAQLDEFLKGFHDIIPAELVAIFNEQELELLISGLPEIDVDDWKSNTEYHNYSASSPQIQWFWRAIRSYDKEERAKLLQFVTGTSKVPLNGFKELEGMNGFSRFNIHRDYGNKERLPSSHTCFNQLDLPEYESYETLRTQVLTAITAGSEYFGFA
ncbi:hypothetical protein SBOR_3890 [Sclerotinia borealis F-4128]|uniref:HECT-type E3 ubiquitin transferase n=1 Tax=Sclerotinia borealis (strain F-4128) TaxID=1432307 RepID=W9CIN6_SCLBF|nr:hypothetical protein SBOR_3890 [Sclerotinia borealis F-4128]